MCAAAAALCNCALRARKTENWDEALPRLGTDRCVASRALDGRGFEHACALRRVYACTGACILEIFIDLSRRHYLAVTLHCQFLGGACAYRARGSHTFAEQPDDMRFADHRMAQGCFVAAGVPQFSPLVPSRSICEDDPVLCYRPHGSLAGRIMTSWPKLCDGLFSRRPLGLGAAAGAGGV